MPEHSRWGYWLARQGGDHLALVVEELEAIDNAVTVPRIARVMRTTPAVVRSILRRASIAPVSGRIYYSPLDVSAVVRGRLDSRGDERATTIPLGGSFVLAPYKRRQHRPTYHERLTTATVGRIEQRAEDLGQWLSCDEAAAMLGVTTQTLYNWRRLRDQAWEAEEPTDRWPTYFRSPPREPRLQTMEEREDEDHGVVRETVKSWRHAQVEHVPSSRRDPLTGDALGRASGRHPPVVYDRNLLMAWVRRGVIEAVRRATIDG